MRNGEQEYAVKAELGQRRDQFSSLLVDWRRHEFFSLDRSCADSDLECNDAVDGSASWFIVSSS